MEFFDKLSKKAAETYKGAAEKTEKIAKEARLKIKINENKSEIENLYKEIGKKVYQKHITEGNVCIKETLEEECAKIEKLSKEIDECHNEIEKLNNKKCKEKKEEVEETNESEAIEAEVVEVVETAPEGEGNQEQTTEDTTENKQ